jgi:hypothetical protein
MSDTFTSHIDKKIFSTLYITPLIFQENSITTVNSTLMVMETQTHTMIKTSTATVYVTPWTNVVRHFPY